MQGNMTSSIIDFRTTNEQKDASVNNYITALILVDNIHYIKINTLKIYITSKCQHAIKIQYEYYLVINKNVSLLRRRLKLISNWTLRPKFTDNINDRFYKTTVCLQSKQLF